MYKYSDKLHWQSLSRHQNLSIEFILIMKEKISWSDLYSNPNRPQFCTLEQIQQLSPYFDDCYYNLYSIKLIQKWWRKLSKLINKI